MGMANQPIISYALRGIRVAEMSTGECNGTTEKTNACFGNENGREGVGFKKNGMP